MLRRLALPSLAVGAVGAVVLSFLTGPAWVSPCGGFFAARGRGMTQPGQQVFITFDPQRKEESYTGQARFEGNAVDFGMLLPIPSRPKLDEMPRDFFAELAVFTALEPMD